MCLNKYKHIVCTFHGLYLSIVLNFRVQIHSAVKDLPLITPTDMTSGSIMETEVLLSSLTTRYTWEIPGADTDCVTIA